MPRRDGTGPAGQGSGGGGGRRSGMGAGGGGKGRRANSAQLDFCECPNCGNKVPHQVGKPCNQEKCQNCGSTMVRA